MHMHHFKQSEQIDASNMIREVKVHSHKLALEMKKEIEKMAIFHIAGSDKHNSSDKCFCTL